IGRAHEFISSKETRGHPEIEEIKLRSTRCLPFYRSPKRMKSKTKERVIKERKEVTHRRRAYPNIGGDGLIIHLLGHLRCGRIEKSYKRFEIAYKRLFFDFRGEIRAGI